MKSWSDIGFEIEITGDGSPSLRLSQPVNPFTEKGESMHHSGGACAETNLIYGHPISDVLKKKKDPSFLIVGLGLGYIEMVIAREALLQNLRIQDVRDITSYESVPELREFFWKWISGKEDELEREVRDVYDQVAHFVLQGAELDKNRVKSFLKGFFPQEESIGKGLYEDSYFSKKFDCILYDAFSSKTSPHLWDEAFLSRFLAEVASDACVFSTYACRGSLKRALSSQKFIITIREGFQGKRNSTLGQRTLNFD